MAKRRNLTNHFLLTASDLLSGEVLFWSAGAGWAADYSAAAFVSGAEAVEGLEAISQRDEAKNLIVGGYLVEFAQLDSGAFEPVEMRERLRLQGPSVAYGIQPVVVQPEPLRLAA